MIKVYGENKASKRYALKLVQVTDDVVNVVIVDDDTGDQIDGGNLLEISKEGVYRYGFINKDALKFFGFELDDEGGNDSSYARIADCSFD